MNVYEIIQDLMIGWAHFVLFTHSFTHLITSQVNPQLCDSADCYVANSAKAVSTFQTTKWCSLSFTIPWAVHSPMCLTQVPKFVKWRICARLLSYVLALEVGDWCRPQPRRKGIILLFFPNGDHSVGASMSRCQFDPFCFSCAFVECALSLNDLGKD